MAPYGCINAFGYVYVCKAVETELEDVWGQREGQKEEYWDWSEWKNAKENDVRYNLFDTFYSEPLNQGLMPSCGLPCFNLISCSLDLGA